MSTLFDVAEQYRKDMQKLAELDLDEQTLSDTLESLSGELELKATNVAHVVRALEAEAETIKAWAKAAAERAKAAEARAEWLKTYLGNTLQGCGIQKVSAPGIQVSFRKSSAVVIDEPALIPAEFLRQKPPPAPEPDKSAISEAIKAGKTVPGAHIEARQNLQIK